jgi:hypothetical protein
MLAESIEALAAGVIGGLARSVPVVADMVRASSHPFALRVLDLVPGPGKLPTEIFEAEQAHDTDPPSKGSP